MAFTADEKSRIKHFLGYPDWVSQAQSIQLGYPAASQPAFLVDDAFHRLTPGGEQSVRRDLCNLEGIEAQLSDGRGRMKATQLGELKVRADETSALRGELVFWQRRLADDLGVVFDPYSSMAYEGMGGGLNAKVSS